MRPGWEYGVPVSFVRDLVTRWRDEYDWRAHEARLNAVPQFTTEIEGRLVHFAHVRSPEPEATPLILTHGRARMARHGAARPRDGPAARKLVHPDPL